MRVLVVGLVLPVPDRTGVGEVYLRVCLAVVQADVHSFVEFVLPVAGLRVTLISSGCSVWRIFRLVLAALCCWNHNLGFALLLGVLLLVEPLAFAFLIGFLLLSLEWKAHR